jgi:hypothetical protein
MMRRQWARILALCLGAAAVMLLVAAGWANADPSLAGTTAANFLNVGAGPRVLGMGGATIGLGQDLAGGAWNPAGLGWMNHSSVMLSHAGLENESLQEWAAIGGRIGKSQTRWSLSGLFQGDGSFEGRDASNNPTGTFSANSFAIGLHVAQQLGGVVTIGAGAKSVNDKLGDATGSGFTFDGGIMAHKEVMGVGVGVGVAAQNMGGTMTYAGESYDFPSNVGVGGSLSHAKSGLSAALDLNFPKAYFKDARAGVEWKWKESLALRAGYRKVGGEDEDPSTGPTFGVGAGRGGFWIDYGYIVSGTGGSGEHRVGLALFPGRWSGLSSDPFGKGDIPRDFESHDARIYGPPAPRGKKK